MSGARLAVTVLGINYHPELTGIAPYTTGLGRGLRERGHDVQVVTSHPHYPQWEIADGYGDWRRDEVLDGVQIRRVRHYVPSRPQGARRAMSELSFGARVAGSRWRSPDAVVCVSPALISSAMALTRARYGVQRPATGLLMQDLYSAGVGETGVGGGAVERVFASMEGWAVRRADGVAVIHDRFKDRVVQSFNVEPSHVNVVRNWTHVRDVPAFDRTALRTSLGWEGSKVVLHAGAMGNKQDLGNVVEAARVAEGVGSDLLFVLLGDGGQRKVLERQARGINRIRFLDPMPGASYGQAMRAADVLLVNEKPGVIEMAVPSKLTSYFSTGVPVLAATEAESTTSQEIDASGAGIRILPGDPVALVKEAAALCADHVRSAQIGSRGPAYCARVLAEHVAIDAYESWIYSLVERAKERRGEK